MAGFVHCQEIIDIHWWYSNNLLAHTRIPDKSLYLCVCSVNSAVVWLKVVQTTDSAEEPVFIETTSRSHQDIIEYELHLSFWYKIKRFEDCKLHEPNQIHISWPCMLLLSSLHTEPKIRKIRNFPRYLNTCLCQHDLLRGLSSFKSDLHVSPPYWPTMYLLGIPDWIFWWGLVALMLALLLLVGNLCL